MQDTYIPRTYDVKRKIFAGGNHTFIIQEFAPRPLVSSLARLLDLEAINEYINPYEQVKVELAVSIPLDSILAEQRSATRKIFMSLPVLDG